jgi:SAM-dependent methyltransferase
VGDGVDAGEVGASYDAMAPQYAELFDDDLARNLSDRELLDEFAASLTAPGPVCDLGCGPGHVATYLAGHGLDAIGIDLSPAMVEIARRLHPGVAFEQGDLRDLGAGGPRFAGVAAYYSLIHLRRQDLPGGLAAIGAGLLPGGVLVAILHEGTGEIHVDDWRGEDVDISASFFTEAELRRALEAAGFTVERLRSRPPYEWELQHDKLQVQARKP